MDDVAVLVTYSKDSLQRALYKFKKSSKKPNLAIFIKKMKCLMVSSQFITSKLIIDNKPVEQEMENFIECLLLQTVAD